MLNDFCLITLFAIQYFRPFGRVGSLKFVGTMLLAVKVAGCILVSIIFACFARAQTPPGPELERIPLRHRNRTMHLLQGPAISSSLRRARHHPVSFVSLSRGKSRFERWRTFYPKHHKQDFRSTANKFRHFSGKNFGFPKT